MLSFVHIVVHMLVKECANMQDKVQGDHSACGEPPVDFKTKVPLWPGLARPGQNGTFVLKSMGSSSQAEWSPCTSFYSRAVWAVKTPPP